MIVKMKILQKFRLHFTISTNFSIFEIHLC